jgi:hypothetical protein
MGKGLSRSTFEKIAGDGVVEAFDASHDKLIYQRDDGENGEIYYAIHRKSDYKFICNIDGPCALQVAKLVCEYSATIASLRAEIERLRAALEPFAARVKDTDEGKLRLPMGARLFDGLTCMDFVRAKAALSPHPSSKGSSNDGST